MRDAPPAPAPRPLLVALPAAHRAAFGQERPDQRAVALALADELGIDATQIPRPSRTMPGAPWLRHRGTAVFAAGLALRTTARLVASRT